MANFFTRIFGSRNQRIIKRLQPLVKQVAALEEKYQRMTDSELGLQTKVLRERLAKGETLDQVKADAFAAVREAGKRSLNMRHFDVQLIGAAILHEGKISEMKT
ncbi:MAG TPA: preprotein translocase subunit SecA, partial [Nevskiaceae bacterium]|nr:preprotein translocase subunit SecA [Nevskiaceae bacterium]